MSKAILGGGCFWCLDAVFRRLEGVHEVRCGYAGGARQNPGYEQVCSGATGHAEVVEIAFSAEVISFAQLLDVFWAIHDPTTENRQGNDVGTQYRSIVLAVDEAQLAEAEASRDRAQAALSDPVVTEIGMLKQFWPAELHHQDYFSRNAGQPYCAYVVAPKVRKLEKHFPEYLAGKSN